VATLREVRHLAGITLGELAQRVGVTRPYASNIESGRERPSPRFVRDASVILAIELGIDAAEVRAEVFGEKLEPTREPAPSYLQRVLLAGSA
jgi:transcriptional regulator with XRE-family HTH domain